MSLYRSMHAQHRRPGAVHHHRHPTRILPRLALAAGLVLLTAAAGAITGIAAAGWWTA